MTENLTPQRPVQDHKAILENRKLKELKNKIYLFFIIIFALFFNGYFTELMGTIDNLSTNQKNLQQKLDDVTSLKFRVDEDSSNFKKIMQNSGTMIGCINDSKCQDNKILGTLNKDIIRNFLLISKNQLTKTDFDQKKVLANIDKFLVKFDNGSNIGNIGIITFAGTGIVDKGLGIYKVPITVSVNFPSKNNLLSFLENVENKINIKNIDSNVLYKVTTVNYDIANYTTSQVATITMDAYFYN